MELTDDASKVGEFRVALVYKPLAPEKLPAASAALPVAKAGKAYQPAASLAGKQPPGEDEECPHPPAPEEVKFQLPAEDDEVEEVDPDDEYAEPELPSTLKNKKDEEE
jgi:hypothetical protein